MPCPYFTNLEYVVCAKIKAVSYDNLNVMETTTETPMGKVITTLVITNRLDEGKAEDGLIPIEQVRSVTLENVWVARARQLYVCRKM